VTVETEEPRTRRQRRIVRQPAPEAVEAVARIRRERGLVALADFDVVLVAASYGLVPRIDDLENEEAHLVRGEGRGIVCIARRVWEAGTWRFPFAHEFGHWMLDRGHDDLARCTTARGERVRGARRVAESRASDFGGEFLVPADVVAARWDLREPGLGTVESIARGCGVSVEVSALRDLQRTSAPRAVAVSKAGLVVWWAETPAFGARVRATRAVPAGSEAAALHRTRPEGVGDAWDGARVPSRAVRSGSEEGDVVVSWLG
jgi:hypothetical protein